ncbi:restriction endonuclease subunit S [Actinocrinis puniceicyclus]|uniref:Restriction endonuclease subunit S n=1 Tax=Actinocrinis puniceicyclus TaxID=977794 RepID=A0A8J7WMV0_9ACTN|nr:restriction endonuclease subunit S [Actinocrinis puniceicyclus]MBS2965263.1 restriction endonuclease subunit S [Actinocrinis puniceicyclus]
MNLRGAAEVVIGRQRAPQHDYGPHMVRYLRAANVKDGTLDLGDVKEMNFSPTEQQIFALEHGDVLVTEGSGSLSSVGAAAVWRGELSGTVCFQNTLLRLRPRAGVAGRFLGWWARSAFGNGEFASIASGANIYHLSADRVRALPISIPPVDEQRRIADFLDAETTRIDSLRDLNLKARRLLDERESAYLDSRFDELVASSGITPLRRLVTSMEQGSSPQCESYPAEVGEWGVLKVSCIRPGRFFPDENKRLPASEPVDRALEVREGDLLITRANTPDLVGSTTVVPEIRSRLLLCDKIFRVKLAESVDPNYIAAVARWSRVRDLCSASSNGASQSMANIRFEEVKNWPIPRLDVKAQRELVVDVAAIAKQTDALKEALARQLALLAERRQALITAAVTGQIDVTTARGADLS